MNRDDVTVSQARAIARRLAEERLPIANSVQSSDVVASKTLYARYGKRALDLIVSGCALIITLPVNCAIGVVTFVDLGSPIFFRQIRSGRFGKEFRIVKFRNMRIMVDDYGDLLPASLRVTKMGKFLRKTSLDELLNFWSVFKGDMSIIGPRPLVPQYLERYSERHKKRLLVRPGLECPPRDFDSVGDWTWFDQFENDVWYVENLSFSTDVRMLLNLVRLMFDKRSTAIRASASRGTFMGYSEDGERSISYPDIPDCYKELFDVDGNPLVSISSDGLKESNKFAR